MFQQFVRLLFYSILLTTVRAVYFPHLLQRFIYDEQTQTIILAAVNHLYALNATDLSLIIDIDTSPSHTDSHCPTTTGRFPTSNNKTDLPSTSVYHLISSSYLPASSNSTFNQLLLLNPIDRTVFICNTANRGGSCQLRTLDNLSLIQNTSQRIVSGSPFFPSIGFIGEHDGILYTSVTYDPLCDPFYELPALSGRSLNNVNGKFLSIIDSNAGLSALQQSTYALRFLNARVAKDFSLFYIYAFEHRHFAYFLTVQESDVNHQQFIHHYTRWNTNKRSLLTKIVRFCQTTKQALIKSYVEIPLTCGTHYSYLVTGHFVKEKEIFYGIFRNTTTASASNTSHAICAYSMATIRESFFQTIKRCVVDGQGYRGLGFISPDTQCLPNKKLNEINLDYCPNGDDSFQYPIGGHRPIEQIIPIIELHDRVNFTSIEIVPIDEKSDRMIVLLGDDNGTIHTFQTSDINEIQRQTIRSINHSTIVLALQLIERNITTGGQLLVLTNNELIKQNLSTCEQHSTCDECSNVLLCHWCFKENKCTATFECPNEKNKHKTKRKKHGFNMCTTIERVTPEIVSLYSSTTQLNVLLNVPLRNDADTYLCQFSLVDREERNELLYYTSAMALPIGNTLQCSPPMLNNGNRAIHHVVLSIYHPTSNLTFGHFDVTFINCSRFRSCSSCTNYSNLCMWNIHSSHCLDQQHKYALSTRKRFVHTSNECSLVYLRPSSNRIAYHVDTSLVIQIEQCIQPPEVDHCQLQDNRKRFSLIAPSPTLIPISTHEDHLCTLTCPFEWSHLKGSSQFSFRRPLNVELSIHFRNVTSSTIPRTHIHIYRCERMAFNCTSCTQLDPGFDCIWCNNMCMLRNQTTCSTINRECVSPVIESIEPSFLPKNGGSLVTIQGQHLDSATNVLIHLADVPCESIEENNSNPHKIVCRAGDAGSTSRAGLVGLQFGVHGPYIESHQIVSYIDPIVTSIEPLIGIQSGGTLVTIHGHNLTLGNGHVSIRIGTSSCQLFSLSRSKIQCETSSFTDPMLEQYQSITLVFDRQTTVVYKHPFNIVADPHVHGFDRSQSFVSGGHPLTILGQNLSAVQNVRLEFKRSVFVSPLVHNNTHLIFLTPSIQELNLNKNRSDHHQQQVEMILHLDNYNQTSILDYIPDPLIFELEPMLRMYTNELIIQGINLTVIGHSTKDILVHIGCDLCPVVFVQSDKIICHPPINRPSKYSTTTKRICYESEHPWIIVTIDNMHSHVGYMIYPRKIIILGIVSGCLLTILLVVIIVLIIVCLKIRCTQRKCRRRYLYGTGNHLEVPKQLYADQHKNPNYEKLPLHPPIESNIDSISTIPLRSYINYLQFCFFHRTSQPMIPPYDTPKHHFQHELIEQFEILLDNNELFVECLLETMMKSSEINWSIIDNLLLTQRYHLKKMLQSDDPYIYFNICILTAYDALTTSSIASLTYQIYHQLRSKIHSGPIDAIERRCSYFTLNNSHILRDNLLVFNSIQLNIHIDYHNPNDSLLLLHVTCLTCDSISQVKRKIIDQLFCCFRPLQSIISLDQCQLYLLSNNNKSPNSCSSSSCSSASTASSSVPLARKSMLTQFFFNRTMKYSTTVTTTSTTLHDPYRGDSMILLLNDVDNTNEQISHCQKVNTLQHYGIITDGYELKLILPTIMTNNLIPRRQINYDASPPSKRTLHRPSPLIRRRDTSSPLPSCHYCSSSTSVDHGTFKYLACPIPSSFSSSLDDASTTHTETTHLFHLFNHTYEEIGECGHLLIDNHHNETYRLFETKSTIHSILITLIETFFTTFIHSDTCLSELFEQHPRFLHIFYAHFVPFILNKLDCLFDIHIDTCLASSFEILATILYIGCCQHDEQQCSLCLQLIDNDKDLDTNIQNCTLLFADEIQRVRLHYSNLERHLNNNQSTSVYSSTNTGINKTFELDHSIIDNLIEYSCSHVEEIVELLKKQSSENNPLLIFVNLVQMYRSSART